MLGSGSLHGTEPSALHCSLSHSDLKNSASLDFSEFLLPCSTLDFFHAIKLSESELALGKTLNPPPTPPLATARCSTLTHAAPAHREKEGTLEEDELSLLHKVTLNSCMRSRHVTDGTGEDVPNLLQCADTTMSASNVEAEHTRAWIAVQSRLCDDLNCARTHSHYM